VIAAERTVLVLLAAGLSSRFEGPGSKLDADLSGVPLGLHAASALAALPFLERVAVTGRGGVDYAGYGYRTLRNETPERGLSGSVRLGAALAIELEADAVLIALADMPRVSVAHVRRLLDAADGRGAVVASGDGDDTGPPALFGCDRFADLLTLEGDAGARALLRAGHRVIAPPGELVDVDTADQLAALTRGEARRWG